MIPKRLIRSTFVRARSFFSSARMRFSIERRFFSSPRSMKSMMITPPMSRSRSWRQTSTAASVLVRRAVASALAVDRSRPELTSMATSASVCSITSEPPDGSGTVAAAMPSISCSRPNASNMPMPLL